MTNKERYIEWADQQDFMPVFLRPWWLDAVCAGKEWDALLATDDEGNIIGAMPYLLRKRLWFRFIVMPPFTQTGGIWVNADTTADRWVTAEVCRQIKEQLDSMNLAYYYQQYLPGSLCVEALRALGFSAHQRVTYRVDDLSDLDRLINSFSKNKKRQLQKALSLQVDRNMSIEDFYRFHCQCMDHRKRKISYTREFLLVLERKARRNKQCCVLCVRNADGQPYAAAFLVWDEHYLYYLIPALDYAFNDSGAGALLVLEAMKLAREKHVHFDFEGSMIRSVAKHYQQFGSTPVTYYSVERFYKPIFRLALWWQHLREWRFR